MSILLAACSGGADREASSTHPATSIPPPSLSPDDKVARCTGNQSIPFAVRDGDNGRAYLVGDPSDGARLGVCIDNRIADEIRVGVMAELLVALHPGGGAPDLLIAGGTTLSQAIGDLYAWEGQRLVPVLDGRQVRLAAGPEWRGDELTGDASYGCVGGRCRGRCSGRSRLVRRG